MSASLVLRHNRTAVIILCNLVQKTPWCLASTRSPPTPWCDYFQTLTSHIHDCVWTLLSSDTFQCLSDKLKWHFKTDISTPVSGIENPESTFYLCTCIIAAVRFDYCVSNGTWPVEPATSSQNQSDGLFTQESGMVNPKNKKKQKTNKTPPPKNKNKVLRRTNNK